MWRVVSGDSYVGCTLVDLIVEEVAQQNDTLQSQYLLTSTCFSTVISNKNSHVFLLVPWMFHAPHIFACAITYFLHM